MKKMFLLLIFLGLAVPAAVSFAGLPGHMKYRMGTIEGQIIVDEKPIADALLAFFDDSKGLPPIPNGLARIPDYTARSGPDGKFGVQLPQGSYYLGVMLRSYDSRPGPPRKGETYYFADGGNGKLRSLSIEDYKKTDYGTIICALPAVFTDIGEHFTVEGVVLEAEGRGPYPGAMVLAKRKPQQRRPDFVSEETDKDGKFSLNLTPGEVFYLVARGVLTGKGPSPGDSIGKYSKDSSAAPAPDAADPDAPSFGEAAPQEGPSFDVAPAADEASAAMPESAAGPPPGVIDRQGIKEIFTDSLPLQGKAGEVVSGIEIYMYKMPDRQVIKESLQGTESGAKLEVGAELNNIFFAVNSAVLDERSFEELDIWANFLKGNTDMVEVSGHTDNVGDAAYNKKLSEQRAAAVAAYLQNKGIAAERMVVVGAGEEQPVEDNGTDFGRERNRRVEVRFLRKE